MTAHRRSPSPGDSEAHRSDRRRFLGYVLAAPVLAVAAQFPGATIGAPGASAAVPKVPEPADLFDLGDALTFAAHPTSNLIVIGIGTDGTASFALPRTEVGQGITTSIAMIIAEELELPVEKVRVGLADARPELMFNQLTGGSNTIRSMYHPVRGAAAIARGRLIAAASEVLGQATSYLTAAEGMIRSTTGAIVGYGDLTTLAASDKLREVEADPKESSRFTVIGKPHSRLDARAAVTGQKKYTLDLDVPNALPTMVCRPPTIKGKVVSVRNLAEVKAMPGVTDVVPISTGVAVRARTFGHCIDGVRALKVNWGPGPVDGESDATMEKKLRSAALPMAVPPALTQTLDAEFTFAFASNGALESGSAVADVRKDGGEIWSSLKVPITTQEDIAAMLGVPPSAVKVHVMEGGGSFGRRLFGDPALEAAEISKTIGKPVKLMWHRTDDVRHGRTHPMSHAKIRVNYSGGDVISWEHRHVSAKTDFGHGLGELLTAVSARLPVGDLGFSETVFALSQSVPYNFGATTQLLTEVPTQIPTASMRNVYSPNVVTARELVVDQLAAKMGKDPARFRREFAKDERVRAVIDKVVREGDWGRPMAKGTAQGIGIHHEYKSCSAVLVEIDCRPETVRRPVRDGVTGPRVTKAIMAVDAGLPINPRGLEAQMMGCLSDGIALALTSSVHIDRGLPLEGSWDNYFYTRQWNTPTELKVHVMPATGPEPGGAGELGVASSFAAVACAYARAVGTVPTYFPINHATLSFEPKPRQPSIPESPTNGLDYAY